MASRRACTVSSAAAQAWLLAAPEAGAVTVQGHNSVVAMLAGASDWLINPEAHIVRTGAWARGEEGALPTYADRFPSDSQGRAVLGDEVLPAAWSARSWAGLNWVSAEATERRAMLGAVLWALKALRVPARGASPAGVWWVPVLVAGTVVLVAGLGALAVYKGLTESRTITENATTARAVRVISAVTDQYRERMETFRTTGTMPPASELERQGLAQVRPQSDDFWSTFAREGVRGASKIALFGAGALVVLSVLKSRTSSARS